MPQPFRFDWKMLEKNYFLIVYMAFLSARQGPDHPIPGIL